MKLVLKNRSINLYVCSKFKDKLFGLMGKKNIDYALRFKCKSIHTFFMKEKIDIIITDQNNKILSIRNNFKKNKILINFNGYYIYELPNNSNTYSVGEIIKVSK